jgi:hypothetical protein
MTDLVLSRIGAGRACALALAALVALAAPGCVYDSYYPGTRQVVYVPEQGPPPWAPAHGYRRKHADGVVLVYDKGLDGYRVDGYPDCYFYGNRFYCRRGNVWNTGPHIRGPWTVVSVRNLPPGLARKWGAQAQKDHGDRDHGHGHGHGHGHDWD